MAGDWTTIDPATLTVEDQQRYAEMKRIYRQYAATKRAFEDGLQEAFAEQLPNGSELKFGYNFGKLSVAVGPAKERKQAKQATRTLTDMLADYDASGLRA